jgi:predicted small lipoprotein YifL
MKKPIFILLAAALALCLLAACGDKTEYEPDMDAVVTAIDTAIGNDGSMVAVDDNYIKGSMKMDVSDYAEYTVKINAMGVNIDEYGVFKGTDSTQAKAIKTAVDNYLQMRKDTWMTEYMPEEFPKLQDAEVWTEGNYVMYAILGTDAKTAADDAFVACFTEG